jgi:hypothetical protein
MGCGGTRQVETHIKQIDSLAITKTEIKIDSSSLTKNDILTDEVIIEPIDSSKPFTIANKTYFNVKISHKKIKDNTLVQVKKIVAKKQDIQVKKISKEKDKVIDKKSNLSIWSWILFLIVILIISYLIWKYDLFKKTKID